MTDSFKLAEHAKVMHTLEHHGHEAFLVGGCVRDGLLFRQSKDYDVTTNATPDEVRAIFPKTIPVGAKFGVVVVVMDGVQIEVATYRADGAYTDGRRPDEVTYSKTAKDDVVRRDFTMNGLLQFATGEIVDYVGGKQDIEDRVIRAIGDPDKRFAEDALRMMRAVRFAAQLGFAIEGRTLEAIRGNARLLTAISRERVAMELFRMLSSPEPLKGLVPFFSTGLYRYALPKDYENRLQVALLLQRFGTFEANKDAMLGMAMLFADVYEHFCEPLANHFKFSNEQKDELLYMKQLINKFQQHLNGIFRMSEATLKRALRKPGVQLALEIMMQDEVMGKTSFGTEALMAFVLKAKAYTPEQIKPAPLVTGKDLIDAGIPPSPIFTEILFDAESHQLNGLWTTKEEAMAFIRERVYQDTLKEWVYMGLSTAEVRELE